MHQFTLAATASDLSPIHEYAPDLVTGRGGERARCVHTPRPAVPVNDG